MRWRKLGLVFAANGQFDWMRSHAANPFAIHESGDQFRIFFSTRDAGNRSSIGWVRIDLSTPTNLLEIAKQPVLTSGAAGYFDDSGTSLACIVPFEGMHRLYYVGWNLGTTIPWRNTIGLASGDALSGAPFIKHSTVPVMERSVEDPFCVSYPCVLHDAGKWRMWYGTHTATGPREQDMVHKLRYAESADGIAWVRDPSDIIPARTASEYAFSRPSVVRDAQGYKMWYSYRSTAYRIGYAESADARVWTRRDDAVGIDVSSDGWDSESIEYPHVFDHLGARYMLYNGNGYGKTGFGLAVLEQ